MINIKKFYLDCYMFGSRLGYRVGKKFTPSLNIFLDVITLVTLLFIFVSNMMALFPKKLIWVDGVVFLAIVHTFIIVLFHLLNSLEDFKS